MAVIGCGPPGVGEEAVTAGFMERPSRRVAGWTAGAGHGRNARLHRTNPMASHAVQHL